MLVSLIRSPYLSSYLDTDFSEGPTPAPIVAHKQDVSAVAIGEWEKELMEDPKVRLP